MKKSRHALDGKIIQLRKGLAIYRVQASPYYRVRVWLPGEKKRQVRTTKATNRVDAIKAAEDYFASLGSTGQLTATPKNRTFEHFADKLFAQEQAQALKGKIYRRQANNTRNLLNHPDWGAVQYFSGRDIAGIQERDFNAYKSHIRNKDSSLSAGTMNHVATAVRKVFRVAHADGVVPSVPPTPREKNKPKPRSYFQFDPLVPKTKDEYKRVIAEAREMAGKGVVVRGNLVTEELRDLIIFLAHSFLRPTEGEVFSLTHKDVTEQSNPRSLLLKVPGGKTGYRMSVTMEAAVSVYERIKNRNPQFIDDDYLFLPKIKNRLHAQKVFQRQFRELLKRLGLTKSHTGGAPHSLYSLRHTAICMRIVLSKGEVNIFSLAKNAGTSVDQIERFYAKTLPLSQEMIKNLQTFGQLPPTQGGSKKMGKTKTAPIPQGP